jgi:hypothetical protein
MNNNDAIIARIKGVPAQPSTMDSEMDPRNPRALHQDNHAPLKIGNRYTIGKQPCQALKRGEGSFPGVSNVHQCPICLGNRTWCETCYSDHHDNGWETCKPNAYECVEEDEPPRAETLERS